MTEKKERLTKYDIAANLTIAGFDDWGGTMSEKEQIQIFGKRIFNPLQELSIDCNNQGRIYGTYRKMFSNRIYSFSHTFKEIAMMASMKRDSELFSYSVRG